MKDEYFETSQVGDPVEPPRFFEVAEIEAVEMLPGLSFKPVAGRGMMFNLVHFEKGVQAPSHSHHEEQLIYVLEGKLLVEAGGEERLLTFGQGVLIPSWVSHGAVAVDGPCLELDLFSPPRQALLDMLFP